MTGVADSTGSDDQMLHAVHAAGRFQAQQPGGAHAGPVCNAGREPPRVRRAHKCGRRGFQPFQCTSSTLPFLHLCCRHCHWRVTMLLFMCRCWLRPLGNAMLPCHALIGGINAVIAGTRALTNVPLTRCCAMRVFLCVSVCFSVQSRRRWTHSATCKRSSCTMTSAGKHVPAATACTAYCLPAAAPGIGTWLRSQSCRLAKQLRRQCRSLRPKH